MVKRRTTRTADRLVPDLSATDGHDNEHNVPEFKPRNQCTPQVGGRARDKRRQLAAEHCDCIDQTEIWQHGVANSRQ
jgi:hypothetical protein